MRKTSHDGVDTTSITSGMENEVKKSSTTGLIKMKKSSIKRKVPNFSHESDDGIVEPLLQSDKDKSEAAPRSAKYLLSKTKTDSISENEDSIKMSEINITYFSTSTPSTAADKVVTTTNMNDVKDSNNVSTVVTTLRNHMNTNVFCVSEASKGKMSTKSPLLVELDIAKTTGYSPSLIFTTAKIHSDCKTKLMEPIQVTPVPITSTTEKDVEASGSINSNKANVAGNSIIEKLNISSKNDKLNLELDIRNNSTSKAILSLTEKSTTHKSEECIPKNAVGNNISIKTGIKNKNISNAKTVSEDSNIKNMEQTKQMQNISKQIESKGEIIEKIVSDNGTLPAGSIKSEQNSKEKGDKKLIVQGSKKLQRQKKATVDEPQDSTSSANIIKDKTSPDDKPTVSQTRTTTVTSTVPSTIATAKSQSAEKYSLKSNNIAKITTSQPIESNKISSQVGSILKPTDSKVQTPVSKNVTQQPIVSSKIPNPVISPPKATDDKIQSELTKNLTLQAITNSKMPSQGVTSPKSTDSKIQTPVSKIPTPTCPVSNIVTKSTSQTTASKTIHDTDSIKIANLNKKEVNLDTINKKKNEEYNKNESSFVNKSSAKEISPVATEKSSPVTKTLPPYIVSTSKAKMGAPVVTGATLKSEVSKSSSDSKSTTSSHLVKMTPASNPKTLTSSVSTSVTSASALKSEPKKLATNSKSSVNSYLVKTTPASSLKTATTLSTPVVTSATLKSEPTKSASDSKNTKSSYSVKTTPAASLKSTTTTVPTPATTSATLKSELNKSASDSKSSTNSYSIKTTPATSLKTSTTTPLPTTSSSSQGTKQSGPVKQTKTNTEKQKDGGKV